MDARRLLVLPLVAGALALATFVGHANTASAEVPGADVPPPLTAAIRADIEARGYQYGGDCRFDAMYLRHGDWCSFVLSTNFDGATVSFGPFATDGLQTAKFVRQGEYGWVNPETGVGSPRRVPLLAAQPGPKPDTWLVEGINFGPNEDVTFFHGSGCGGEQRCPGDHQLATVEAGADGAFQVTVSLDPNAKPLTGQVHRLIQASNGSFIQVAFHHDGAAPRPTAISGDPSQPNQPAPADPGPGNPDMGDPASGADSDDANDAAIYGGITAAAVAFLAVAGVVTVRRSRA